MNNAFLKTEYVEDLGYQALATMTGILLNARSSDFTDDHWNCVSPLIIAAVLTGKEPTFSDLQAVNKGLRDLEKLGWVTKYSQGYYVVDYQKIVRTEEKYVCLEEHEVRAILNSDEGVNRFSLLQYFAYLKSTIDYSKRISNVPLTYLTEGSGKSLITVRKYHDALEELGVLKVFRFRPTKGSDGELKRLVNIYFMPEDVDMALQYIQDRGIFGLLEV